MDLLKEYIGEYIKKSNSNNIKIDCIGDLTMLREDLQEDIKKLEEVSRDKTGVNLHIALNYGSRDEIIRGIRAMAEDIKNNKISEKDINEESFSKYLDTKDFPDPELIIRTSGECRLSNFLLWQAAYSEFYFTDKFWPDFTFKDFMKAIEYYQGRDRRFGGRNEVE